MANKQQQKKRPQPAKVKEDVQPRDILALQAQIMELKAMKEGYEYQIKSLTITNQELKGEIDGLLRSREAEYDQSTMTIKRAALRLRHTFDTITCPITRREAFKQFVADVVITNDKALQQANEKVLFDSNVNNDLKDFMYKVNTGQIAKPAAQYTNGCATVEGRR